jgi:hypothetical protein
MWFWMGATRPKVKNQGGSRGAYGKGVKEEFNGLLFFDDLSKGFIGVSLFIQQPLK